MSSTACIELARTERRRPQDQAAFMISRSLVTEGDRAVLSELERLEAPEVPNDAPAG